jgi:hypothetical protein
MAVEEDTSPGTYAGRAPQGGQDLTAGALVVALRRAVCATGCFDASTETSP